MIYDTHGNIITSFERNPFTRTLASPTDIGEILKTISKLPLPSKNIIELGGTYHDIWHLFDKVAEQADVKAAINDYRNGLASMEESVISNSNLSSRKTKFFQRYLDFLNAGALSGKSTSTKTLRRIFTSARDFGFTVIELCDWKTFEGKLVPTLFKPRPRRYFGVDANMNIRLFTPQHKDGISLTETYPNNFIALFFEQDDDHPYGRGLLDAGYYYATGLNGVFEFMMNFLEEDGRDRWVGFHKETATPDEKERLLSMLTRLRNNAVAVIPENARIEKKEVSGRSSTTDAYQKADEILTSKILKLWFGTDLLMQKAGKGGYAQTQSGLDIRLEAFSAGIELCEQGFGQLFGIIENINALEGSRDENIIYQLYHARSTSKEEAEMYKLYQEMTGVTYTESFLMNRGFSGDEFEMPDEPFSPNTNPQATFAATPDRQPELDALLDAYEVLKKKSSPRNPNST
jgi:hypothetical protein